MTFVSLLALLFWFSISPSTALAQAPQAVRTVLEGVYTEAQATRGLSAFQANCSSCHLNDLSGRNGPPLKGPRFTETWREFELDALFNAIKENMPPRRSRAESDARLPDAAYLDILTYILQGNSFPAGNSELTLAMLEDTLLVGMDGPKSVPNGALVYVVGCLVRASEEASEETWMLVNATEPVRTRTPEETDPAELGNSEIKPLGTHIFRLQNFDYIAPKFDPAPYASHRVQAKGYLIRQPNRERINVTSFETVVSACKP